MSDQLYICPTCQRTNFTLNGLRAHSCVGKQRLSKFAFEVARQPETQEALRLGRKPGTLEIISAHEPMPPVKVVTAPSVSEEFAQAKRYHQMAQVSAAQSLTFMALAGFELTRLHKLHGVHRGRPSANSANAGGIKWPDLVKRELGISENTAGRYMDLAHALRKKLPEINTEELLNTPVGELPELKRLALINGVSKVTDGQTYQQLGWDLGFAKKPHGAALRSSAGGDKGGRRGKLTAEDKEAIATEAAAADRDALAEAARNVLNEKSWLRWATENTHDQKALKQLKGDLLDILDHLKNL